MMTSIPKPWVGKKVITNPEFKEKHKQRKIKKQLLNSLLVSDWKEEVNNYNNNNKVINDKTVF